MGDSSASGDAPDSSLISSSDSNRGGCHDTADTHSYASTLFKPFGQQGYNHQQQHSRCPTSASMAYAPRSSTGPGMHLPLYPSPPSFPPPSVVQAASKQRYMDNSNCSSRRKMRRKQLPGNLTSLTDSSDYSATLTLSPTDPKRQKRRNNFKWPLLIFLIAIASLAFLVFFYLFVSKTGIFSFSNSSFEFADDPTADYSDLYGSANGAAIYNLQSQDKNMPYKRKQTPTRIMKPLPTQVHVGQLLTFELPPRRIAYTQFSVQHDSHFLFNLTVSPQAKIVLYTRQTLRPTPAQYDFQRLILGDHLHLTEITAKYQRRRRRRHLLNTESTPASLVFKHALLKYFLLSGQWFFGFLNDDATVQSIRLQISAIPTQTPGPPSSPTSVLDDAKNIDNNSALQECQFNCFGKGVCHRGKCQCHPGYSGQFCEETACPVLCSGNGVFSSGRCMCHEGYRGVECELLQSWCTNSDCSGHGRCTSSGHCECDQGWSGEFCADAECVDPECSGHGICNKGQCFCVSGWWGERCEQPFDSTTMCAATTIMKGQRRDENSQSSESADQPPMEPTKILLPMNQEEPNSNEVKLEKCAVQECANGGSCTYGMCQCASGWTGEYCTEKTCLLGCEIHGRCMHETGKCECHNGWTGANCFVETCAKNCSNVGKCQESRSSNEWRCVCDEDHFGESCEFRRERNCDDGVDNDEDGLTDCEDSVECCGQSACTSSPMCLMSEVSQSTSYLMRPSPDTTFFDRVKFIFEGEYAAQRYVDHRQLEPKRVSVVRGRVFSSVGGPLSGVRVSDAQHPQHGFSITRTKSGHDSTDDHDFGTIGTFDLVVNGGGFVTLQFVRQPFGRILRAFYVPWNRIVDVGDIEIDQELASFSYEQMLLQNTTSNDDKCRHHRLKSKMNIDAEVFPYWETGQFAGSNSAQRTTFGDQRSANLQVYADSGVVIHRVPIGNEMDFVYSSARADAFRSRLHVQMLGAEFPQELGRVYLVIQVAGRRFRKTFAAIPKLAWAFNWDRVNGLGQMEHGLVDVDVAIGYEFENCTHAHQILWYQRHARLEGAPIGSDVFGTDSAGPWTLNIQHRLDPINGVLERGDGSLLYVDESAESVLTAILGNGAIPGMKRSVLCADTKDNCKRRESAESAQLFSPSALAIAPDGRVFIGDHNWIRRLSADGTSMDTLLELDAMDTGHQYHLAFDTTSNALFISLPLRRQIWRLVETDKTPTSVANNYVIIVGTGESCVDTAAQPNHADAVSCGDGGPAERAQLSFPKGLAFDAEGHLYIADGRKLRVINKKSQYIHTIVSDKPWRPLATCTRVFPLEELNLEWPSALTLDPLTGQLFVLDSAQSIYRLDISARVAHLVVGTRERNCDQQTQQKISSLNNIQALAFDPVQDILYLSESDGRRVNFVRAIHGARSGEPETMRVVAGRLGKCDCHPVTCPCDTSPTDPTTIIATQALLYKPTGIATHPEKGILYIADQGNAKLKRLERLRLQPDPESRTFQLNSPGTDEVFTFDPSGRHLWTASMLSGRTIHNFSYFSSEKGAGISRVELNGNPDLSAQFSRLNETWIEVAIGGRGQDRVLVGFNPFDRSLVDSILLNYSSNGQLSLTSFEYGSAQLLTTSISYSRPTFIDYDPEHAWPRNITLASGDQFQISVPVFMDNEGLLTEVHFNQQTFRKILSKFGQTSADGEKKMVFRVEGPKDSYALTSSPIGYQLKSLGGAHSVDFARLANHPLLHPHESSILRQKITLIGADDSSQRQSQRQVSAKLEWRNYVRRATVNDDSGADNQGPRRVVQVVGRRRRINGRTVFSVDYDRINRVESLVDSYENELLQVGYDLQGHVTSIQAAVPNGRVSSNKNSQQTHPRRGNESKTVAIGWRGDVQHLIELDLHYRPIAEFLTNLKDQWLRRNISYSENPYQITVEMPGGEQFFWTNKDIGPRQNEGESSRGFVTIQQQWIITPSGERHIFQKIQNLLTTTIVHKIFGEKAKNGEEEIPVMAFAGKYDWNGRLIVAQSVTGQLVEFVHNQFDHLVTIRQSNKTLSVAFTYDQFGRVVNASSALMDRTLSYEGAFLRSSRTRIFSRGSTPPASAHFFYEYTGGDQLFRLSSLSAVFNDHIAVEPLRFHYAGSGGSPGALPSRVSDTVFEYSSQKTSIIHSTFQLDHDWSSQGNNLQALRLAFSGDPILSAQFSYDPIGRLTSAKWTTVKNSVERTEDLEYHQNGHTTQMNSSAGHWNLGWDQNLRVRQINGVRVRLGVGGVPLRFGDVRYETEPGTGWTLRRGNAAFDYDAFGQIIHCTIQGAGEEESSEFGYVYDDLNRLIKRTERFKNVDTERVQTFHYAFPHAPHLITHFTDSNTNDLIWTIGYTPDNDEAFLLENSAGQRFALVVAPEKSVRFVVDITGSIVRELAYSPTGATVLDTNPGLFLPIGYRSQFHDHSANLVYFYDHQSLLTRPFDPVIGRFMSTNALEMNKWSSTLRRPEQIVDPFGYHQDFGLDRVEHGISSWMRRRGYPDLGFSVLGTQSFEPSFSSASNISPFSVPFLNSGCADSIVSIGAICAARRELQTFHQILATPTPNKIWWHDEAKFPIPESSSEMMALGVAFLVHEGQVTQLHFSARFDQTTRSILEQIFVGARVSASDENTEDLLTGPLPDQSVLFKLSKAASQFDQDQKRLFNLAKDWPLITTSINDSGESIRIEFPWNPSQITQIHYNL